MISRLKRLWYTVRPLKREQIVYRFVYKLFPLKRLTQTSSVQVIQSKRLQWQGPEVVKSSLLTASKASFLNLQADITKATIWNNPAYEKLWLYNLHYFDDLNAIDSLSRKSMQHDLVTRWISENPPVRGNGWEPYPLSLRLVNWSKWYNRSGIDDQAILDSIAQQAEALSKQLEYHILGNHLFANAKALVFVGCFLGGELGVKYLKLGLKLLDREIPEQFLSDGGHFELSPMYHCILLWDLLDLINLANIALEPLLINRLESWKNTAAKAFEWLKVMTHPDGEVAFFNDSTIGIAASPSQLKQYAATLNLHTTRKLNHYELLKNSGYSRITYDNYNLIFDHGEVGPSYLPGHAHADALSFEMSLGERRFFVNSGTSLYGLSEERHRQRGTAAHNTVVVGSEDSSEVWGGFRVARRAHSIVNDVFVSHDLVTISASHDGYTRLTPSVKHNRNISASNDEVIITDSIDQVGVIAMAYFHVHPDIKITIISDDSLELQSDEGQCIIVKSSTPLELEHSTYHPGFGVSVANQKICVYLENEGLEVSLKFKRNTL